MRFSPAIPNFGFDDRAWPRLQVIPVGETRTVSYSSVRELIPRISGKPFIQIFPSCPTSRSRGGVLTVKGVAPGEDKIVWVRSGNFRDSVIGFRTLRFLVLEPMDVQIAFNFIKNPEVEGEDNFATNRPMSQVKAIIQRANDILQPQTNIRLIERASRTRTVSRALEDPVVIFKDDQNGVIRTLKETGDPAADVNVFLLWDLVYQQKNQRSDDVGLARSLQPEIFIDDTAKTAEDAGLALAHELLHIFTIDHVASDEHLMAESYVGGGTFIPSSVAKRCHLVGGALIRTNRRNR